MKFHTFPTPIKSTEMSKISTLLPINTVELFPKIDAALIAILKSLSAADWERSTIAPKWRVKDIAAHLLDGNIRAVSMLRDNYFGETPSQINTYQDLVSYLNQINADWVQAMRRVSPAVLVDLLETTGREYCTLIKSLNPYAPALFSVAWAGEETSLNWFHIAREYTEKWHHQQQIRLAVGQEQMLYEPQFYHPYLNTSMMALPHHYRDIAAPIGEVIRFKVTGEGGGHWFLRKQEKGWSLIEVDGVVVPICEVEIESTIAWRLFTKGISREAATQGVFILGNRDLGEPIFDMLAVMA